MLGGFFVYYLSVIASSQNLLANIPASEQLLMSLLERVLYQAIDSYTPQKKAAFAKTAFFCGKLNCWIKTIPPQYSEQRRYKYGRLQILLLKSERAPVFDHLIWLEFQPLGGHQRPSLSSD